jgi:hypothetical protein
MRQPLRRAAVCSHDKDIKVAVAIAEGNPFPSGENRGQASRALLTVRR